MKVLTLNIPDGLDLDNMQVAMFVASKLYEQGKLSLGQIVTTVDIATDYGEPLPEWVRSSAGLPTCASILLFLLFNTCL
jgi:hypothetical protein